jgi:hypothetical protein
MQGGRAISMQSGPKARAAPNEGATCMQGGRAISMESGPIESPGRPRDEGRLEEPPAAPTCR